MWFVLCIVVQFDPGGGGGGGGGDKEDLEKIKILRETFKIMPWKKIPNTVEPPASDHP